MTQNAEKLLELTRKATFSGYGKVTGPLIPERVFEAIFGATANSREAARKNNDLLESWLYPMLCNPDGITPEHAKDLYELAQALFRPPYHIDTDLAFRIYDALAENARSAGDLDMLIKCLYWKGLSLFNLNKKLFHKEILDAFSEAASYRSRYREFENFDTRIYINRSIGNVFVTINSLRGETGVKPSIEAMDEAYAFWTDPEMRAADPEMPWDKFVYSIHQTTCTFLDRMREERSGDAELAERVYSSAMHLKEHAGEYFGDSQAAHTSSRPEYTIICAKYHSGRASARETAEKLLELSRDVKEDDYSYDATYRKTHLAVTAIQYLENDPDYPREELELMKREITRSVISYCSRLPMDATRFTVNAMIAVFVDSISSLYQGESFIEAVLRLTTFRHMPTYIHSLMVSRLAEIITAYFCDNNPGYLIGVDDTETESGILEKRDKIVEFAKVSGLCHDVGKIIYMNTIATYGRELSGREFAIIGRHPDDGFTLLRRSNYNGVAEVARGHHKWYDGTRGYPEDYDHRTSRYRQLIDIVAACDSIDAATDVLGRTYKRGLSINEIIKEIQEGAGTRYSPAVAYALRDSSLAAKIEEVLDTGRKDAYFTAYRQLHLIE